MPLPLLTSTELLVTLFAFVTLLGDAWVLVVGLSLLYWFGPRITDTTRPVAATLIGLATLALAVVLAIKSYTAIPRPPATPIDPTGLPDGVASFVAGELDSTGFTFPSGHATGATAVYGGLGVLLTAGRRRLRYAAAGAVIALVSASRVVLGVHYLRDVIAGTALGVVLIGATWSVARDSESLRADRVFLLAAVASACGFVVAANAGHTADMRHAVIGLGIALGGSGAWRQAADRLTGASTVSIPVAVAGLSLAGGLLIGSYQGLFGPAGAFLSSTVGIVIILWLPLIGQWRKKIP